MSYDNSSLIRELVPKGYHFDAYNELNSPNSRDRPFFEEGVVPIGKYYLVKKFDSDGALVLQFSSVCPHGHISFKPYRLTFGKYIQLLRDALQNKSDFITFEISIEYKNTDNYYCKVCEDKSKDCLYLQKHVSSNTTAAVSFEPQDIKNALSVHFGITPKTHQSKGGNIMKNNNFKKLLGMNFEFGISKDTSIAGTFMGVAIRNPRSGNYYVYDPATKTLKNYANMKFGDFRVFLLPESALIVDQLYKLDGKYYYVQAVDGNMATLVDAVEGTVIQKILSECVIPGMNFYTRVVALDPRTMFDTNSKTDMSKNILAAICMTQWSKGESDFSLDGIGDDSFNGLGMLMLMGGNNGLSSMMNGEGGMSLPMLIAMGMGNESDDANSVIQYMLLGQIMNGGNANPANLFGSAPALAPAQPVAAVQNDDTVFCPNCGEEYPAGTNFCSNCGAHTEVRGKHCTACGAKLTEGAAFCHNCGQKVVMDTCPKCNSKLPEGAKFCSACGHNLSAPIPKAPAGTKSTGTGKRGGRSTSSRSTNKKNVTAAATEPAADTEKKE